MVKNKPAAKRRQTFSQSWLRLTPLPQSVAPSGLFICQAPQSWGSRPRLWICRRFAALQAITTKRGEFLRSAGQAVRASGRRSLASITTATAHASSMKTEPVRKGHAAPSLP